MFRSLFLPLAAVCALVVSITFGESLLARCRCDGCGCDSRREARHGRRMARRGVSVQAFQQPAQVNPGGWEPAVNEVGAAAEPSQFYCVNGRCWIRTKTKVVAPAPVPDPQFTVPQKPPEASKTEAAKAPVPSDVETPPARVVVGE